jgi:hypothetical protein
MSARGTTCSIFIMPNKKPSIASDFPVKQTQPYFFTFIYPYFIFIASS